MQKSHCGFYHTCPSYIEDSGLEPSNYLDSGTKDHYISTQSTSKNVSILFVKNILQSLLSKKSENSLQARLGWLSELHQLDEVSGLKLALKHITSILNDSALTITEKTTLIFAIEDANHASVCHQLSAFAKIDNLKPEITTDLYENNYIYNRTLLLAHAKLMDISFNKAPDQQPSDATKTILIARGLIYASHMLMWRYYEHAAVPANIWLQANTFYQYAETHLLLRQTVQPFHDQPATTIKSLYVQLVMLGSLNFSNLLKPQVEIIHALLASWMSKVTTHDTHSPSHTFFIDLTNDDGVSRIRNQRMPEQGLFWEMDGVEFEIDTAIKQISAHKRPAIVENVTAQNTHLLLDTLTFLKKEWSRNDYKRQRRRESRHEISKSATVSIGIHAVLEMLKQFDLTGDAVKSLMDGTLNDRRLSTGVMMRGNTNTLVSGREKWNILDESELGLGSLLTQENSANIKPNKLVSIFTQHSDTVPAIGVVRNIKQMSGGKIKIGMEIFTHHPNVAILKKFDLKKEHEAKAEITIPFSNPEFGGIYIPNQTDATQPASIILPKLEYMPNTFYEIVFNKRREIVKFQAPIESGDDWVRLSFPEELR